MKTDSKGWSIKIKVKIIHIKNRQREKKNCLNGRRGDGEEQHLQTLWKTDLMRYGTVAPEGSCLGYHYCINHITSHHSPVECFYDVKIRSNKILALEYILEMISCSILQQS